MKLYTASVIAVLLALLLVSIASAQGPYWGERTNAHYWYFRHTAYWQGQTWCVFADAQEQVLWNPAYISYYSGRPYCPRYIVTY